MNLFHRIRRTPTHLAHLLGRKKASRGSTEIFPGNATTKPARGGLVLPFRKPAPAPQPRQEPAPQREAAELTADRVNEPEVA